MTAITDVIIIFDDHQLDLSDTPYDFLHANKPMIRTGSP